MDILRMSGLERVSIAKEGDGAVEALLELRLVRLRALFVAEEPIFLPSFMGSALRGAFGRALKRISCNAATIRCDECLVQDICTYRICFDSAPPRHLRDSVGGGYDAIPRPFVLDPFSVDGGQYQPGESFLLDLVLIADAVRLYPHFISALLEMGRAGFGKGRGKAELRRVDSLDPVTGESRLIFESRSNTITGQPVVRTGRELIAPVEDVSYRSMILEFQTPARLKTRGKLCPRPEFETIVRALLRRISMLLRFHQQVDVGDINYAALVSQAASISLKNHNFIWVDHKRYSSRQRTVMKLGGVLGTGCYEGELSRFVPLIKLGEQVHIGKGSTFGLGRFRAQFGM